MNHGERDEKIHTNGWDRNAPVTRTLRLFLFTCFVSAAVQIGPWKRNSGTSNQDMYVQGSGLAFVTNDAAALFILTQARLSRARLYRELDLVFVVSLNPTGECFLIIKIFAKRVCCPLSVEGRTV